MYICVYIIIFLYIYINIIYKYICIDICKYIYIYRKLLQLGRSVAAMLANLKNAHFVLSAKACLREVDVPVFLLKQYQFLLKNNISY